jgi:hypothetical protein
MTEEQTMYVVLNFLALYRMRHRRRRGVYRWSTRVN